MIFNTSLVQLYPTKFTITQRREREVDAVTHNYIDKEFYKWGKKIALEHGLNYTMPNEIENTMFKDWVSKYQNVYKKQIKKSVNLSENSKRLLQQSIMGMYMLSKPRTIKINSKKFIYNFRTSFITLTLPSEQKHSDVEIKACLNLFLNNIRYHFKVKNYVWKAELQKNENIHFHLIFDKYIPFQAIRYYWLLAIKPLGYVEAYKQKFINMTLSQYANYRGLSIQEAKRPFAMGARSNWETPNCIDVEAVNSAQAASYYLSKYFAKSEEEDTNEERIAEFGKVWARSRSLSKLKYKNKWEFSEVAELLRTFTKKEFLVKRTFDYCTVFYFNFKKMPKKVLSYICRLLEYNAVRYNYPIPVT